MCEYIQQFKAMGSPFMIRIDLKDNNDQTKPALSKWMQETFFYLRTQVEEVEQCFSRFRADSELTKLNRSVGQFITISPRLAHGLRLAEQLHELTNEAFDPRIFTTMERIGYHGASLQSNKKNHSIGLLQRAVHPWRSHRALFQWKNETTVKSYHPIDLGGLGKGYTADVIASHIEQSIPSESLAGYIVDAGGDIVLAGSQSNGEAWSVGVEDPFAPDNLAATMTFPTESFQRLAVCTSSIWKKSWNVKGKQVHHLIDPKTKKPASTPLMSVTVINQKAVIAEALTKFIFLRGIPNPEDEDQQPIAYLSIDKKRKLHVASKVETYLSWISQDVGILA